MVFGWLTVLKAVPWSEVISNAPMVAGGAKRLWRAVSSRSTSLEPSSPEIQSSSLPESQIIAAMELRIDTMEVAVTELQAQMLASSELIKELAEQNAQLIRQIETIRLRITGLAGIILILAIASVVWLYTGHIT